jgi:carboxyl-terminal processing protease
MRPRTIYYSPSPRQARLSFTVSPVRIRATLALLWAALCLVVAACTGADTGRGSARVAPAPDPTSAAAAAQTAPGGSARLRGPAVMGSEDLRRAYQFVLQRYVDPVDHGQLIRAGVNGLRAAIDAEGALPLLWLALDVRPLPRGDAARDWESFGGAYDAVVQKLPDWAESKHADRIVLQSMLRSLEDGHSIYVAPEEVRRQADSSYAGIGVRLAKNAGGGAPLVAEVFRDSPAAAAGLQMGDRIMFVDGQALTGRPSDEVVRLIRGPLGSTASLLVQRGSAIALREFRLQRAQVRLESVEAVTLPSQGVMYLHLRSFSPESPQLMARAIQIGQQSGVRGWILDLRGNPGGGVAAVQQIAGLFLDNRTLGYQVDREQQRQPMVSVGAPMVVGDPVMVMVDGDSSSGAEILAANLRDYRIATVVGTQTAGIVSVATKEPLADGGEVQVTVQRFETSTGERLDRVGVKPNMVVELRDVDLEVGVDSQLKAAMELIGQRTGR